jgi:predicted transcriptional regulator of viral defense system
MEVEYGEQVFGHLCRAPMRARRPSFSSPSTKGYRNDILWSVPDRTEDRLFDLAGDQDGYFAVRDAVAAGIPKARVQQMLARGRLERLSRGVYRLRRYPVSRHGDLWAAVLWPKGNADVEGILSHETALRLHDVTDVNPASIHVTIPTANHIKREPEAPIVLHRADLAPKDVEGIEGLPVTTLERTLLDLRAAGVVRWADELEAWLTQNR